MSAKEMIASMVEFNAAMNTRLWDIIEQHITDEQFVEDTGYSQGSIQHQMIHVANAEMFWAGDLEEIWGTESEVPVELEASNYPTRASARAACEKVDQDFIAFAKRTSEADLDNPPGWWNVTVWGGILHVFTHGVDHRAQVLQRLHQLGAPTFTQDMADFLEAQTPMPKDRLLARINKSWDEWQALLNSIGHEHMSDSGMKDGLSIRDSIALVTWGERELAEVLKKREFNRSLRVLHDQERDQRIIEASRSRSYTDHVEENQLAHRQLVAEVEKFTEADLNSSSSLKGMPSGLTLWRMLIDATYFRTADFMITIKHWLEKTKA
jgi:uncharacterized damage-inducible protein DinB